VVQSTDLSLSMAAEGDVVTGWDDDAAAPIVAKMVDQVSAGSRLQYTYTVKNDGLAAVADVVVEGGLPFTPDQVVDATCAPAESDPTLTRCTVTSVPAGGEVSVVVSGLTASSLADGAPISHMSSVSSVIPDVCADNDGAANSTTANTAADYGLGLQPVPPVETAGAVGIRQGLVEVTPGSQNRYEVTLSNAGPSDGLAPQVTARLHTLESGAPGEEFVACEPIAPLTSVACEFEAPDTVRVTSLVADGETLIAPSGDGRLPPQTAHSFYLLTEVARDFLKQDESGALPFAGEVTGGTTDYRPQNNSAATAVHVVLGEAQILLPFIAR
jgi:hypothetical protein